MPHSSSIARLIAIMLALLMAAVGCGDGEEPDTIRLQANAVGGGQLFYENLAEQDTVLWFWAPW